jgi:hypothetical protein
MQNLITKNLLWTYIYIYIYIYIYKHFTKKCSVTFIKTWLNGIELWLKK